jgi:formylglycine-generating enzyme
MRAVRAGRRVRSRRLIATMAVILASAAPLACSLLLESDNLAGNPAVPCTADGGCEGGPAPATDAAADAGTERPDASGSLRCNGGTAGPEGLDGGLFCIDATEVTVGQYAVFRNFADAAGQPEVCAWNVSFVPRFCVAENPGDAPERAVVGVDWCDALAYCRWAGKRLCGKVGGEALDPAARNNPNADEWFGACSNFGRSLFPYGNSADASACNTGPDSGTIANVGSHPGCAGGLAPQLHDMVGNAMEWVNECTLTDSGPQGQSCHLRGGNYTTPTPIADCDRDEVSDRNATLCTIGFRCCSDP